MTTTPGFLSATLSAPQDLYTITYPNSDLSQISIANVSKANTAVVTTNSTLPITFIDGNQVLVTGVAGMTQLATAGVDSSRVFFANVVSSNTFGLFTDAELTANVNSTSFSNATANTGGVSFFTVPQYNTMADGVIVQFDTEGANSGTDIALNATTGVISLGTDLSFSLTATVNTTAPVLGEAGYQWYDVGNEVSFGPFVKFGEACTTTITTTDVTDVALKVYSTEGSFEYPNQVTSASFTAEVIGGYTVV